MANEPRRAAPWERKKSILRYAALLTGAAILSFGLYNIHDQSAITEGGVLGLSLLAQHWLGVSPAIAEVLLDVACYTLGFRRFGRAFLLRALAATGVFALSYALWQRIGYLLPDLSHAPLPAAVLGAAFVGVGVGVVVRAGGAACGDDALALVIAGAAKWPVSRAYFLTDATVLLLSLSYIPPANVACSLLTAALSSWLIDRICRAGKERAGGEQES